MASVRILFLFCWIVAAATDGPSKFLQESAAQAPALSTSKEELVVTSDTKVQDASLQQNGAGVTIVNERQELVEVPVPSNLSANPYLQTATTAEALAAIFFLMAFLICWIQCCK